MLIASLVSLLASAVDPTVYHGRQRELDVRPPRIQAEVAIDGRLEEEAWKQAAVMTGFSRYTPTDGVPADDSTEVLVWYSPTAIYFGIRAFAPPGTVNSTLADRDKLYNDDFVSIFLGTFNNGRETTVFTVNPLGSQGDGTLLERGNNSSGTFGALQIGREPTDVSPDFLFQSKGRVTGYGYEVEVRIPFKSLRYQSAATQTWGVNILRRAQARGYEYSWAPAERAAASFVGQFGHLTGLTGLQRGLVLDLNPILTSRRTGLADAVSGDFGYANKTEVGGNVRWGISADWSLNGTINPDFAEVESDAGQIVNDPRRALFFAERRPFFLDGIEQFAVANNLVYTRRIAAPVAAAKVIGKNGGTTYALLSAVDDQAVSFTGKNHPVYNILRLQHDLGKSSRLGFLFTDRRDGDYANSVVGADARVVWKNVYSAQLQAASSRSTTPTGEPTTGQSYQAVLRRAGRRFGAQYRLSLMDEGFDAQAGFISRPAVVGARFAHSYTTYGAEGSFLERATFELALDGLWTYPKFVDGGDMIEKKLHFNTSYSVRGGWQVAASGLVETFGFDDGLFANVYVQDPVSGGTPSYRKFSGRDRLGNIDYVLNVTTPSYRQFSASAQYVAGRDENFYEWTSANIGWIDLSLNWRPTEQLRISGTYDWQGYRRLSDNSEVAHTKIPRMRAEYQVTRSIFVRAVAQYTSDYADDLRESDRSNSPLYRKVGTRYVLARGFSTAERRANLVNNFRPEFLFSYLPSPGTVIYAGFNTSLSDPRAFGLGRRDQSLVRQSNAVFVKLSWLFRA